MKIEPIASVRPSNAELARQGAQLHDCLEDLKQNTERDLAHVKTDLGSLRSDMDTIKADLGVGNAKKNTMATQARWKAYVAMVIATGAGFSAVIALLKLVVVIGPYVKDAAIAVLHALMSGKL